MPWSTSGRRKELPPDWHKKRAAVKRRAGGRCEARIHEPECDGIGTDCDHITDPHDHSLNNLQWLSPPCHRAKTLNEAKQSKAKLTRKRKIPRHPGMA